MTGRALVFALFVVVAESTVMACTSTQVPLVQLGGACTDDVQCAAPLVCRCEIVKSTDDEGNDQIIPGSCQKTDFDNTLCQKSDAAVDSAPFDSHLPPQDAADADETAPDSAAAETDLDTAPEADLDADGGGG